MPKQSPAPTTHSGKDVVVQRSFTCPYTGPMTCNLQAAIGEITVIADESTLQAEVTLEAAHADDETANELVNTATCNTLNGELRLVMPEPETTDHCGLGQIQAGRGIQTVNNTHAGMVVVGAGNVTVINGQVIVNGTSVREDGAVRITARIPKHSTLLASTTSAGVNAEGELSGVEFRSTAGTLYVEQAEHASVRTLSGGVTAGALGNLTAQTTSGHVRVERLAELSAHTVSGDVDIAELIGKRTRVSSTSGDISMRFANSANVSAHTVSGDIQITSEPGTRLTTDAGSVSGRVRLPSQL